MSLHRLAFMLVLLVVPVPAVAQHGTQDISDLVARLLPSVVNIAITHAAPLSDPSSPAETSATDRGRRSVGSGFVIDPAGLVLTNRHVIENAAEITVTLHDGTALSATLVAAAIVDLAVLRVAPKAPLKEVSWGDSTALRQGQPVIAIGNPFGYSSTVTTGIVSALDRDIRSTPYDMFVQTDASINPGNSGGPLFNVRGEVIGINTAISTTSTTSGSVGIGFAIPSNDARFVLDRLMHFDRLKLGWLSLKVHVPNTAVATALGLPRSRGVIVTVVDRPELAEFVQVGDVILEVGDVAIRDVRSYNRAIGVQTVGTMVPLRIWRDQREIVVRVPVEENPEGLRKAMRSVARHTAPNAQASDFGLSLAPLTEEGRTRFKLPASLAGVLITGVAPFSPAAEQGLQPGEVILRVHTEAVATARDFWARIGTVRQQRGILILIHGAEGARWVALPDG